MRLEKSEDQGHTRKNLKRSGLHSMQGWSAMKSMFLHIAIDGHYEQVVVGELEEP